MMITKNFFALILLIVVVESSGMHRYAHHYGNDDKKAYLIGGLLVGSIGGIATWEIFCALYNKYSANAQLERQKRKVTADANASLATMKTLIDSTLRMEFETFQSETVTHMNGQIGTGIYPSLGEVRSLKDYFFMRAFGEQFQALAYSKFLDKNIDLLETSIGTVAKVKREDHYPISFKHESLDTYLGDMSSFHRWLLQHRARYKEEFTEILMKESFAKENHDASFARYAAETERIKHESALMAELAESNRHMQQLSENLGSALGSLREIKRGVDNIQPGILDMFNNWALRSNIADIKTDVRDIKLRLQASRI